MSATEIRDVMWQLTCGVKVLRCTTSVWHRDLKSANILLLIRDGLTIVKIADLGALRACAHLPFTRV
jgi:serine/threonine protein kinase